MMWQIACSGLLREKNQRRDKPALIRIKYCCRCPSRGAANAKGGPDFATLDLYQGQIDRRVRDKRGIRGL
jgi:hypothetical protein